MITGRWLIAVPALLLASAFAVVLSRGNADKVATSDFDTWRATSLADVARFRTAYEHLKVSAAPRDQALASQMPPTATDFTPDRKPKFDQEKIPSQIAERAALLRAAADAAPDDKLVQWLALFHVPGCPKACRSGKRVDTVQRLEPDNGLAWSPTLLAAIEASDDARIDNTLERMAQAGRYDDHTVDYTLALLDIAGREPGALRLTEAQAAWMTAEEAAVAGAFVRARTTVVLQGQFFGEACHAPRPATTPERIATCATLGRRISREAPTVGLRVEGLRLLRATGRFDDADNRVQREMYWYLFQLRAAVADDPQRQKQLLAEARELWVATRDDVAVIRALLERHGLPATPPDGWQPPPGEVPLANPG